MVKSTPLSPYVACILAAFLSVAGTASADKIRNAEIGKRVLQAACVMPYVDAQRFREVVPDGRFVEHRIDVLGGRPGRARTVISMTDGREITVSMIFPGDRLRRVSVAVGDPRPMLSVRGTPTCDVQEIRAIEYKDNGTPDRILILSPDLTPTADEILLNPDVQPGSDPGGVSVAVIDSGINYTVAPFKDRLARTDNGTLIGKDFWDGDERPFDIDNGRSPFFPLHHGSAVTSIILSEAPQARVFAVRYPRPDMTKMANAVSWIAEQNIRIVNLAMGSNSEREWAAFAAAARSHPQILFVVSAGNNGRNIDRDPVFPASLDLANTLVVTSSEANGRLARGSNWGARSVDIMVPGERMDVIDHRGAPGKASGSSFAVPRVTALAVRMLGSNPDWHGPELREAILKRARSLSGPTRTRYGWIPDPTDGP